MKRIFFYAMALFAVSLLVYCTSSGGGADDSLTDNSKLTLRKAGDPLTIGYVNSNSEYVVYRDSIRSIKTQWDSIYHTTFSNFNIVKIITDNDPNDAANLGGETVYLLTSTGANGNNVGMNLTMRPGPIPNSFDALASFLMDGQGSFTVNCDGCFVGCHISILGGKKKFVYYCDNPCSTCKKSETWTNAPLPTGQ